jgi:hypothetical protein
MQKALIGFLALTTAVLGALCILQARQVRETQDRAQAAESARAAEAEARQAQAMRVGELERVNKQLDQQVQKFTAVTTMLRTNEAQQSSNLAAMARQVQSLSGSQGAAAKAGEGKGGGVFGKDMGKMLGSMMKDPAMREMLRDQQKAMIKMMYGGLFKELKMSPEEESRLKELLTDSQMANIEAAQGLFGDSKDSPEESGKRIAEAKKQTDAKVKEMLGDERYTQYEDYQKSIGERMQVDQLKMKLAGENLPLADQQTSQLLQIMKEEKTVIPPVIPTDNTQLPTKELFTAENIDKQLQWMDDYNKRVQARAAGVLSPEQFKQYQDWQEQQAAMQKMGMNMARQMFGKEGNAPEPGAVVVPAVK